MPKTTTRLRPRDVAVTHEPPDGWWIITAEDGSDAVALAPGRRIITVEEFGVAERVFDCINALDGISDPAATLAKVRADLTRLAAWAPSGGSASDLRDALKDCRGLAALALATLGEG